jgi:antirestriction protein
MFRNIETGKRIEDRDYRRVLRVRKLEADRAAKAAAEKESALEEREEVAERVAELGEYDSIDSEPFNAWLCNIHSGCCHISCIEDLPGTVSIDTLDYMIQEFQDAYAGEWGSEEEYTQDAVDQGIFGEVGQGTLSNYLDVQSLSRDLFMSDMYSLEAPHYRIFAFFNV